MDVLCPHCAQPQSPAALESTWDTTCGSCGGTFTGGMDETEAATMLPGMENSLSAVATAMPTDDTQPIPQCGPSTVPPTCTSGGPKVLGHFRLDKKLGEGACGAVYKAYDTKLDRIVAIKIPRGGLLLSSDREQFLREARAAAQLRHPNIVSVHEVSRNGNQVFIVSDFIEGQALDERLKAGRLPEREALELFVKIADALDHAHQQGVVHRDLKPANILLDKKEEPYVADFGLAKRDSETHTIHNEGSILGTPAYMAPEQAQGNAHAADRRADVYSLGVILYEMLTGQRPFHEHSLASLLLKIVSEPAPSPRKIERSVSKDLETICLKCLEKKPENRYQSAQELAEEIRRFLKGEPILSRPITEVERLYRWCRRNPMPATLFAAVIATGVLGGIVSGTYSYLAKQRARADAIRRENEFARREAELAMQQAEAAKLRAKQEPAGWTSAQIDPEAFRDLEEAEAVDRALDQYQNREGGKPGASDGQYDVKELTKVMVGINSKSSPAGQRKMLNKLEGDLEFLNQTLGTTPKK